VPRTYEACAAALTVFSSICGRAQDDAASGAWTIDIPSERFVLDNGMTVIVAPDPDSRIVAVRLVYRVGSRDEDAGATGLAHLFEHMMFCGTQRYGAKQFDAVLERAGGYGNAYTKQELTAYVTEVPPESLATVLDLEADRMVGLQIDAAILERERQVVLQERREVLENQPPVLLGTLLMSALFQAHPDRWPVLGWVADIEAASVASCRAFYRQHYAPNRAVLVLAGAVEVAQARKLATAAFGALPPASGERRAVAPEPTRTFRTHVVLEREVATPRLLVGFLGPCAGDPEHAVLDLLAQVLVRGHTARLGKRLQREDRTVTSVALTHTWTLDAEPFVFAFDLSADQPAAPVIDALFDELARLVRDGVGAGELARARTGASAALLRMLATAPGRATHFGELEVMTGDHRTCLGLPARYEQIDSKQLQDVCAHVCAQQGVAIAELRARKEAKR
jgi:predicted Zn-dependent peptidase